MYEELYAELPDVERYWNKLGLDSSEFAVDVASLDEIVFAHQRAIPFENLDVCGSLRPVSLGIVFLFEKIIAGQRGGYCFELNALFEAFLAANGFNVKPCMARSLKNYGFTQPVMHRGEIVVFEDGQRRYCDVGYGGPVPACSMPLEDGARVVSQGQIFRIDAAEGSWWHISYCGAEGAEKEPVAVLAFLDQPCDVVDFVPLSHFASTHPNSVFTQRRLVNRRTEQGSVSITADQFTAVTPTGKEVVDIESEEQFRALLLEHFGIVLPSRIPRAALS